MDTAQELELRARRHQKPMNDVIGRGDSAVQQFYCGTTVFVTGGSGFIGKQLIEKLLRACAVKKIYLLSRSKKGLTIQKRLENMLKDPVYDSLREQQPRFTERLLPVEGDVAAERLGLSDDDWNKLKNEVNIIFHVAATVRFDEPLRVATLTNVRGTREALALAKQCTSLKTFVHVSTAFAHATKDRIDSDVLEQFYPCPVPPATMIALAEQVDVTRLDGITPNLIEGWPNTYTFTKALAEDVVRSSAGDLPVCIVRPPIVVPTYYEPSPGWLDLTTLSGPSGIYLGIGLGVVHVFWADENSLLPMAPVDYVNNAIIAAAWDAAERRKDGQNDIRLYTIVKNVKFNYLAEVMRKEKHKYNPPQALWKIGAIEVSNSKLYFVLTLFLHYIPAFFIDLICTATGKKPQGVSSFVDIFRKLDKLGAVYNYFLANNWNFKDDHLRAMTDRMSPADKAIFNCNVATLDLNEYIVIWGIGIRKYILKDGLKDTAVANRNQKIFTVLNVIFLGSYAYVIWYVICVTLMFLKALLSILCIY